MTRTNRFAAGLSAIALLSGCTTTLGVQRAPESNFSAGIPAVLPFTRYEITVTWRLASCEKEPEEGRPRQEPKVAIAVEATSSAEDDPEQTYVIDANSLQGPANTAQFNVTYHDNSSTLRTVNAEVEDRSAAIIGNVVRTAVALAPMIAGAPVRLGARTITSTTETGDPPQLRCQQEMKDALVRVGNLAGELDRANQQVARATDEVTTVAAIIARMGGTVDVETSARYARAIAALGELTRSQTDLAARLADALKPLTYRQVIRWPNSGSVLSRDVPARIDETVLNTWFGRGASSPEQWEQAYFKIIPVVPARAPQPAVASRGAPVAGIPYRTLVRGRLVTCPEPCLDGGVARTVVEGPVAQLGGVNLLPVRNPPFGSTSFSAEFRRDGTLVSAGYAQRTAPLEQATGAIAGAAEAIGPLLDPTARLNAETAYLEALQARRDALTALQPAPTEANAEAREALAAETTLLNAQISNLQARITLQELQARTDTH